VTDQWRAKDSGYWGNAVIQSPHLDRLASEGGGFRRCFVQNPVSTPSRASMASGWYCHVDEHRSAIIAGYHQGQDRCVRDETWSYVRRPEGEPDEQYNLADDPRETRNLVDEQPGEARRLASHFGPYFYRAAVKQVKGLQGRYEMGSASVE